MYTTLKGPTIMKKIIAMLLAVSSLVMLLSACEDKGKEEKKPSKEANIDININMPEKKPEKEDSESSATETDRGDVDFFDETSIAETRAPESGEVKPFFMDVYHQYLLENQENMGHAYYYEKGNGRFALIDITGSETPELLIIAEDGATMILAYEDDEVVNLSFISGGTDITRYNFEYIRYNLVSNKIYVESANGNNWTFYSSLSSFGYDSNAYIMTHRIYESEGKYYFNTYDVHKLYEEGFSYLVEFEETEVSKKEYKEALENWGVGSKSYSSISEDKFYPLTPEYIDKICG